jgi:hypothetical protein
MAKSGGYESPHFLIPLIGGLLLVALAPLIGQRRQNLAAYEDLVVLTRRDIREREGCASSE